MTCARIILSYGMFIFTIFYFMEADENIIKYEGKVKNSSLTYNQRETLDKWQLDRDPDRSWCHWHISVKLFWSQLMAARTPGAAYECAATNVHAAVHSMGCDQESFTLVWRWHQLLSGSLPNGRVSRVSRRL